MANVESRVEPVRLQCDWCGSKKLGHTITCVNKDEVPAPWRLFNFCTSGKRKCLEFYKEFVFEYDLCHGLPFTYKAMFEKEHKRKIRKNGVCGHCRSTQRTIEIPILFEYNFACLSDRCLRKIMKFKYMPGW
jgi:hypothetical protein